MSGTRQRTKKRGAIFDAGQEGGLGHASCRGAGRDAPVTPHRGGPHPCCSLLRCLSCNGGYDPILYA